MPPMILPDDVDDLARRLAERLVITKTDAVRGYCNDSACIVSDAALSLPAMRPS
jgi:hypothetical protein